ncbi:hypothetical protein FRB93_010244 [Tulasnella sp. JGI-2019a]|nr:hypothetical protein FRB93_010244 [Tulasnella sp. JGI-2019a]
MAPPAWNIHTVAGFVSLGGLFYGLDTGAIGPITVMPQFLATFSRYRSSTIQGVLVATFLMAASATCFFSGWLSGRISRKHTIMIGALVAALGSALEAASVTWWMLLLGRLIAGAGEGIFLGPCGVYLIELSPPNVRGQITTMLQVFITVGVCCGYFICYGSVNLHSNFSWRTPFIIQSVVALTLAVGMHRLPYSPRWLLQVGREEEAWIVMEQFDRHGVEREKEDFLVRLSSGTNNATLKETMRDPTTRWRAILAMFLMGMQQLSGIDAVLYFAPLVFRQAGLKSQQASFLASGVSGILLAAVTLPTHLVLMDRWGRRPSTIWGGVGQGVCMFIIAMLYASGGSKALAGKWIIISLIYVFLILFSVTWAVSLKLATIELQPSRSRAVAASLSQSICWVVNTCVALTTPVFLSAYPSGPYFLFAACLAITSIACVLFLPETLGRSLTEVDTLWNERTVKTNQLAQKLHLSFDGGRGGGRRRCDSDAEEHQNDIELRERRNMNENEEDSLGETKTSTT